MRGRAAAAGRQGEETIGEGDGRRRVRGGTGKGGGGWRGEVDEELKVASLDGAALGKGKRRWLRWDGREGEGGRGRGGNGRSVGDRQGGERERWMRGGRGCVGGGDEGGGCGSIHRGHVDVKGVREKSVGVWAPPAKACGAMGVATDEGEEESGSREWAAGRQVREAWVIRRGNDLHHKRGWIWDVSEASRVTKPGHENVDDARRTRRMCQIW